MPKKKRGARRDPYAELRTITAGLNAPAIRAITTAAKKLAAGAGPSASTMSQAEWADEFARQHKATIVAKKKQRTKLSKRKLLAPAKPKKTTTTKTRVTRTPR